MNISIVQLIFAVFPESLLLSYVGLGLIGIRKKFETYLKLGAIYTSAFAVVRLVLNYHRLHSLILCLALIIIFKMCLDLEYSLAIIAALLGMIILILGDVVVGVILVNYFNLNLTEYINSGGILFLIFFYIMKLPLLIVSILIYNFDFKLR